jgi:5-methyltetrahydrofolate corrinoid/iron sulfur protein methyltransferase
MKSCKLIIIGERINSTRKSIARAIEAKDAAFIQNEARLQNEAGADFIDVNAGVFLEREIEYLPWLVRTVQEAVDAPLSLDTPNPEALKAALKEHRGIPLINSITLEKQRLEGMAPLASEYHAKVIALSVDATGMPADRGRKREVGLRLVDALNRVGIKNEDIFLDPITQPVCTESMAALETTGAMAELRTLLPDVHILCGLRNISFHLPQRRLLDMLFLPLAMAAGADAAILDPCDTVIMTSVMTAEVLLGKDEYCLRYIQAHRDGWLGQF